MPVVLLLLINFVFLFVLPANVTASKPTCLTADCHVTVSAGSHIHAPLSKVGCTDCHEIDLKKESIDKPHKFPLKAAVKEKNCLACHPQDHAKRNHSKKAITVDCSLCHDSHAAQTAALLKKPKNKACIDCHKADVLKGKHKHHPTKGNGCDACHTYHRTGAFIRPTQVAELCMTCHDNFKKKLHEAKSGHKPFKETCDGCHEIHSSNIAQHLKAESPELCQPCHQGHFSKLDKNRISHGALGKGRACLNCHESHYSAYPHLLKMQIDKLCFECHNTTLVSSKGKVLPNIKKIMTQSKYLHGPVKTHECAACHNLHGGNNDYLLKRDYPYTLYAPYSREAYALCFECHSSQMIENPSNFATTNFTDGRRNLHAVHVNNPKKGQSCTVCHDIHGSNRPFHIKDETNFGTWTVALNFKKFDNGGSCTPACHEEFRYTHGQRREVRAKQR